jgi:hypothetical protein
MDRRKAGAKAEWPAAAGVSICGRSFRAPGVFVYLWFGDEDIPLNSNF